MRVLVSLSPPYPPTHPPLPLSPPLPPLPAPSFTLRPLPPPHPLPPLPSVSILHLKFLSAHSSLSHTQQPPPPPVHLFPSLQSLSLLYVPSDLLPITRCSSLSSLTLESPEFSTLFSLAFSSSSSSSHLASSPPSPLRTSLTFLTIHSAKLQGSLASLAFFPSLASLSLHTCTIDPYELSFLSRSLHKLTHITIHSCPLVSSRSLIPILQANPALSSLSLHGTTYRLFGAQGFRSLLSHSSSQLRSLHLAGLPSFRPGLLAACNALRSLSLEDIAESSDSIVPRSVSLDGIAAMLVRVEQIGGGAGGEAGGEAGGDGGVEEWERGRTRASAAAAEALVSPRGSKKHLGKYLDVRTEAEAARADKSAAMREVADFFSIAKQACNAAFSEAAELARAEGDSAVARIAARLVNMRFGISVCQSFSAAIRECRAAVEWEEKLMRSFDAAGRAAGFFAPEMDVGEEEGDGDGDEEEGDESMDVMLHDEALLESELGGVRIGAVEARSEALNRLKSSIGKFKEASLAMPRTDGFAQGSDCPICWEAYDSSIRAPHVLLCGHTFCKHCVLILPIAVFNKLPSLQIQLPWLVDCPLCHWVTPRLVVEGNLQYPFKNFSLLWLLEASRLALPRGVNSPTTAIASISASTRHSPVRSTLTHLPDGLESPDPSPHDERCSSASEQWRPGGSPAAAAGAAAAAAAAVAVQALQQHQQGHEQGEQEWVEGGHIPHHYLYRLQQQQQQEQQQWQWQGQGQAQGQRPGAGFHHLLYSSRHQLALWLLQRAIQWFPFIRTGINGAAFYLGRLRQLCTRLPFLGVLAVVSFVIVPWCSLALLCYLAVFLFVAVPAAVCLVLSIYWSETLLRRLTGMP
ncbi:unnamed protein product [Closterium sp. Naga37s-1]|nr:unnamed protein product [Closterium sp. Naga37s-1]